MNKLALMVGLILLLLTFSACSSKIADTSVVDGEDTADQISADADGLAGDVTGELVAEDNYVEIGEMI